MDCSLPGSSIHEIFQARVLEWVAISYPEDLLDPGIEPMSLYISWPAGGFFITSATWEAHLCFCSVAQSCLTLWEPMDYSWPVSSVHGIVQARVLEWVAISYSKGSSLLRD